MKANNIVYADLSTYTIKETISFYEKVFGWNYHEYYGNFTAYIKNQPVVGLYETPEKFQEMGMPHFWMTYIEVNDIKNTVEKARELGGIIEIQEEIPGFGNIALIRDPQGAGFTIYQGNNLSSTRTKNQSNTLIWNELHVSNAQAVIPFYEGIFDWKICQNPSDFYKVRNRHEEHIANILEIPNEIKGKYEYWVCTFGVDNLQQTKNTILQNSGSVIIDEGNRILCADNSGQAFFYIEPNE